MSFVRRSAARVAALGLAVGMLATLQTAAPALAEDAVAGALTAGDTLFPHQGNGGYDVQHYDVRLAWTPGATLAASTIAATVTIDATTVGAPLSSYALDFEGSNLTVSSVTVGGAAAAFTRVDGTTTEPPAAHKLVITPATPVSGAFRTVVTYSGVPSSHLDSDGSSEGWNVTADGATFLAQPIGAMAGLPVNNTPADKATYTFALDIPTTITNSAGAGSAAAVSNGELLSRTPNGDGTRTTWVWNQTKPMATELILISIGKYDMVESTVTLTDGRVIPEWSFIDSAQSAANKTTFTNRRAQLSLFIQRLEQLYGPYPGNSTGIVMDTVPSAINYALETQDRSFFPSVSSLNGNTLIHELAHQWFGDAVAPRVWNDIWINEGMATWGPTWNTNVLAAATANPTAVETTYFNSWNNTAATSASWNTPPSGMTLTSQLYGYQTYTRGAQLYEALRTAIGTPAFLTFVKQWEQRFGGGNGGAADFEALAEEVSGRDLTAFFLDWVHESGKPAWPFKHDLSISGPSGELAPGSAASYTVTATNTGRVAMTPVVTVDLADVLDDATLDPASLPAGAVLEGTTITWTVPSTPVTAGSNVATLTVPVTLKATASDATLLATTRATTLGSTCVSCSTSSTVPIQPVNPSADPTITGTPKVGVPLTAVTDGWLAGTTFAYQWLNGGTPIAGATQAAYTPVAEDLGDTLSVRVVGSREHYLDVTRTSAVTAAVLVGDLTSTPTPTITGTPQVGVPLTAVAGTWDAGVALSYQWRADGVAIAGATGTTYVPGAAQIGTLISVVVTGTKPGYTTMARTSASTTRVVPGSQAQTPVPTITGTPQVGETLTAAAGTWDTGVTLSYQWRADGVAVAGATGTTYVPGPAQAGAVLTVAVTGTRSGYTTITRVSEGTAPVALATQVLTPTPIVTGAAQVGGALTGVPGTWDVGTTLTYQWLADGAAIDGATGLTFTPGVEDLAAVLTFAVTGERAGYETVTVTSDPTAPVAPGTQVLTPTPTVAGTPRVGLPLTAVPGTWDSGVTLGYRWLRDGEPIAGAVYPSYTLRAGDLGAVMSVVVTGRKAGYDDASATSAGTEEVALGTQVRQPAPTVRGVARVGARLSVAPATFDPGVTLNYAWYVSGAPTVVRSSAAGFTPAPRDVGKRVRVTVVATRAGYLPVLKTSAFTVVVKKR